MYFKNVEINNYGMIGRFNYQFKFNKNGNPIPLVLIGENGSGKTLMISNLVDALIEVKRKAYGDNLLEVNKTNYYKIGSKAYIKNGSNTSKIDIRIDYNGQEIKYMDIMSLEPKNIKGDTFLLADDIKDKSEFEDYGYCRYISNKLKRNDYSNFINLYFPTDRFYLPLWYNDYNYKRIDYTTSDEVKTPKTNLIKNDILSNIHNWLIDVYFDNNFELKTFKDDETIPIELRGKTLEIRKQSKMQEQIDDLINRIIFNDPSLTHSPINRKDQKISFATKKMFCEDINQLSEGQISLFAIAISIIKEWDINHDSFNLEDIKGIVIIDEADLGLHIDYAYDAFPRMMKAFPNVQFVISTHSPFMVSGIIKTFGDEIDIITMPDGIKIEDPELFSEMGKAREILKMGIQKQKEEISNLQKSITELTNKDKKVIIYTEGKTDVKYLKIAFSKYNEYSEINKRIEYYDINHSAKAGDGELKQIYEYLQKGNDSNIKICIFDRDVTDKIISEEFEKGKNHVFRFNIPIPKHRSSTDKISIEHYLTDDDLATTDSQGRKIFMAKEFDEQGRSINTGSSPQFIMEHAKSHSDKNYNPLEILTGSKGERVYSAKTLDSKNYVLSKDDFVSYIERKEKGFEFEFSSFKLILDIIKKIVELCEKEGI